MKIFRVTEIVIASGNYRVTEIVIASGEKI